MTMVHFPPPEVRFTYSGFALAVAGGVECLAAEEKPARTRGSEKRGGKLTKGVKCADYTPRLRAKVVLVEVVEVVLFLETVHRGDKAGVPPKIL